MNQRMRIVIKLIRNINSKWYSQCLMCYGHMEYWWNMMEPSNEWSCIKFGELDGIIWWIKGCNLDRKVKGSLWKLYFDFGLKFNCIPTAPHMHVSIPFFHGDVLLNETDAHFPVFFCFLFTIIIHSSFRQTKEEEK